MLGGIGPSELLVVLATEGETKAYGVVRGTRMTVKTCA